MKQNAILAVLEGVLAAGLMTACARTGDDSASNPPRAEKAHRLEVVAHELDSAKGRDLFVSKGCVVCHAVNGVGGKAAPVLDAEIGAPAVDPLDFAARMWLGAPAMIELQSLELGYTIHLTADDLANLAAFAGDVDEQKKLSIEEVPEMVRDSFLDERFWEVEDWDEFLEKGQEGYEPEPPAEEPLAPPEEPEPPNEP